MHFRTVALHLLSICACLSFSSVVLVPNSIAGSGSVKLSQTNTVPPVSQKPGSARHAPKIARIPSRNLEIVRLVSEIDARNIERTIRKLVSFGTRNTLSEQNDPNRGIGGARDWLSGAFNTIAAASNGRLT